MSKGNLLDLIKFDESEIPNDTLIDMVSEFSWKFLRFRQDKLLQEWRIWKAKKSFIVTYR